MNFQMFCERSSWALSINSGGGGSTPCSGDSGGGYFTTVNSKTFLRGIVSSASVITDKSGFYCDTQKPAVFTDVGKFAEWIESTANLSTSGKQMFSQQECIQPTKRTRRALGGSVPQIWAWLARVFEKFGSENRFVCGGSLISQRHVLTTAYCIQPKGAFKHFIPDDLVVFLGHHPRSPIHNHEAITEVRADPKKFIIHPQWDPQNVSYDADIAVIELTKDAQFSEKVFPICLFTTQMEISEFAEATFVGW